MNTHTGTDATIAQHIQTIIDREYVTERKEGSVKYLIPSSLGIGLVEGYDNIGFERSLSKPQLRREVILHVQLNVHHWRRFLRQKGGWFKYAKETQVNERC